MAGTRAHVILTGDVQGVFFRGTTRLEAERRGVTGWVRNRPDGSIEAVFEGESIAVEQIVNWCRTGPPRAEVENLDVEYSDYQGEFVRFSVL